LEPIRIGTRKSKLAIWQAEWVSLRLKSAGIVCELVPLNTIGDRVLDVSISKIGSKGVFTEEIEKALEAGEIDIAVHSAKDMPSSLPEPFELIAFGEREPAHDVLISFDPSIRLTQNAEYVIGTSSTRRVATLRHYYPKIRTKDIRGNLQTRMDKLKAGPYEAIILAFAGVRRMGYEEFIAESLKMDQFVPPTGQGSIAIEALKSMPADKRDMLRHALNHNETEQCVQAERAFLKTINGGCSIPVFAYAIKKGISLEITGGVRSLDGEKEVMFTIRDDIKNNLNLGRQLAEKVLEAGGDDILRRIRNQLA
jgi:hydroxymethylbilane synthase